MRSIGIEPFLNTVIHDDARNLLGAIPTGSVDAVITDPMYGTAKNFRYPWGVDLARGDPHKHGAIQAPFVEESRRVLKPGGILAWAQGFKFITYFDNWFGPHRVWSPICTGYGPNFSPNTWVVQTREQRPIEHPNNMLVRMDGQLFVPLKKLHICPKPVEEMRFLIAALTKPGQIVLDCFCGLGSTLVAAQQLGRKWIGCDWWRPYCQVAMRRLDELEGGVSGPPLVDGSVTLQPLIEPPILTSYQPRRCNVPTPGIKGRKDEWQTPRWLFDLLNGIFHFSVDAAANADNALLPRHWDREQDALRQDWSRERVWCNPPYSRPEPFLAKASTAGLAAVLLRADCLTTHYAHDHPPSYVAVCKGRIPFDRPEGQGDQGGAAPFGSVLYLYGVITATEINALKAKGFQVWRFDGAT
jgi:site-specific DNA-methyltransferase (adenine-specific)